MSKKLAVILMAIIICFTLFKPNKNPIFCDYASNFEIYLNSASSNANIVQVDLDEYNSFSKIKGESFKTEKEDFCVFEFFREMKAVILFTETVEEGVSYYGYSRSINYMDTLKGQTVNLHVFISNTNNQVTIGSPIIYGSF